MKTHHRIAFALSTILVAASCADAKPDVFTLTSGVYDFTLDADDPFDPHTCWEPGFPPSSLLLQFQLDIGPDGDLVFAGSGVSDSLIAPLTGQVDGDTFSAGPNSFELDGTEAEIADPDFTGGTANCTLVFEAVTEGTITGENQFDARVPITISDLEGDGCEELYGDMLSGGTPIPFPAVESGPCILGIQGSGVLPL